MDRKRTVLAALLAAAGAALATFVRRVRSRRSRGLGTRGSRSLDDAAGNEARLSLNPEANLGLARPAPLPTPNGGTDETGEWVRSPRDTHEAAKTTPSPAQVVSKDAATDQPPSKPEEPPDDVVYPPSDSPAQNVIVDEPSPVVSDVPPTDPAVQSEEVESVGSLEVSAEPLDSQPILGSAPI